MNVFQYSLPFIPILPANTAFPTTSTLFARSCPFFHHSCFANSSIFMDIARSCTEKQGGGLFFQTKTLPESRGRSEPGHAKFSW